MRCKKRLPNKLGTRNLKVHDMLYTICIETQDISSWLPVDYMEFIWSSHGQYKLHIDNMDFIWSPHTQYELHIDNVDSR